MKMRARMALLLTLSLLCPFLAGCNKEPEMQAKTSYECFDTVTTVFSYVGDDPAVFESRYAAVEERLKFYHKLFDIYYEYRGVTNLKTVNRRAGQGPVTVDRELIDFLLYAKEIYTLTGGKVNIAMGAVLSLWHDCREDALDGKEARLPDPEALREASEHCDINDIVINEELSTVEILDPKLKIDVGALGKGYAGERVMEYLREQNATGYVVNLGGNLCMLGTRPSGKGWVTGITNPDGDSEERFACRIEISDISCVTSGNYERYYTVSGVDYHHIIDPETLYPTEYFDSVTVLCTDSALADALSTALFCMTEDEGRALIGSIGGVEVLWIYDDGTLSMTDGFRKRIVEE